MVLVDLRAGVVSAQGLARPPDLDVVEEDRRRRRVRRAIVRELDAEAAKALDDRLQLSPVADLLAPSVVEIAFAGLAAADERAELVMRLLNEREFVVQQIDASSEAPALAAQMAVLVIGEEGDDALALEQFKAARPEDEPLIVIDAVGGRPDLAEQVGRQACSNFSGLTSARRSK